MTVRLAHRGSFATGMISTATGPDAFGEGVEFDGLANFSLWGNFVGTLRLERSFGGGPFIPCTAAGTVVQFDGPASEPIEEPEEGVVYRVACTAWTSGDINWRISR